jgi:hypothetical protein
VGTTGRLIKENIVSRRTLLSITLLVLVVGGCSTSQSETAVPEASPVITEAAVPMVISQGNQVAQGPARGMGQHSGMMARHHAAVPEPYAGMVNPVLADHSSQMLGDDMLFWRISEGGTMPPINSSMPAWKDSLDEQARWDLVNYLRALGTGQVRHRAAAGGAPYDPDWEQARHAEMLSAGVAQAVITQAEADLFEHVHAVMDELAVSSDSSRTGGMDRMRDVLLAELVNVETITQDQADAFDDIHDRLVEAGLMD